MGLGFRYAFVWNNAPVKGYFYCGYLETLKKKIRVIPKDLLCLVSLYARINYFYCLAFAFLGAVVDQYSHTG